MSAATKPKRRMGIMTILSSIFILVAVIWATYTFILVQSDQVRQYTPHEELPVDPWPYNLNWAGGEADWFDNINYTDLPLDMELPEDLLAHLNDTLFVVDPGDPPQLWRSSAYDTYDGAGWTKTLGAVQPFNNLITQADAIAQGNTIYTVYMNVSAGASVGNIELPTLFPEIQVIEDSFQSNPVGLLTDYVLETDEYNTLLFSPLIQGTSEENVLISFDLTFTNQDLASVEANALPGSFAGDDVDPAYLSNPTLSQNVTDDIAQFSDVGTDAYDKALAVDLYFRSNFQLIMDLSDRPDGQEVTEWFLERGGGLPMDFATAYCVYMRELGIPARMVTGYAVGDMDSGRRVIQVKHMMFWAEVFIPMTGHPQGGEWIQVVPIGLGGNEVPENTDPGDVQIYVFNPEDTPWALVGDPFNLSAILTLQGIAVTTPEEIFFTDVTDGEFIGTSTIGPGLLRGIPIPMASLSYIFPANATIGNHIISASWQGPDFTVTNFTTIIAVGVAVPMRALASSPPPTIKSSGFIPSAIIDVDFSLGLDTYTAYWQDIVLAHGIMTVGGDPVDGTNLTNDQVQIMWDEYLIGNATIQPDGYYEYQILVDPSMPFMSLGPHEVWALYAGDYHPIYGYPIILPGRSADNSTVDVWGTVGFTLAVDPDPAFGGATLTYNGTAFLLNDTPLDTQTIDLYFNGTYVGFTTTNSLGEFEGTYVLPASHPAGVFNATVSWTSLFSSITGNFSAPFPVTIQSGATVLTIDSDPVSPQLVHIGENITIWGQLTIQANGTGLAGRTINIYWDNGTTVQNIGPRLTNSSGHYVLNFTVPAGYEGPVTYWAEFPVGDPVFQTSRSNNMTIDVKKWDIIVQIDVDLNPVHLDETLTITGNVTLPEYGGVPLGNAPVTIWWWNNTISDYTNLTVVLTSSVFPWQFTYPFPIPQNHPLGVIPIYAEFVSRWPSLASNQSASLSLNVTDYASIIDLYSNSTYYHLNETAHIWGQVTLDNGTQLAGVTVYVHWNNGSASPPTPLVTNSSGWFDFYYPFVVGQDTPGIVSVFVNYTSPTRLIAHGNQTLPITVQLYQLILSASTASPSAHLDEVIEFSGTLIFDEGSIPIPYATVTVYYLHSNGTRVSFTKFTNSTGGFYFQYNLTLGDLLGAVYLWANYSSTNPLLWENATSLPASQVNLTRYLFDLSILSNGTDFHLDEVIHIWGQLTYQHNSTPLAGQSIKIYWTNSIGEFTFQWYTTNTSGWFNFYYNVSIPQDDSGNVTIVAEFISGSQWWNDTTQETLQ
ncbi:MAG: transglutaminase-like domain-containing protein [Candidatus Thorarchaeota archaeon]